MTMGETNCNALDPPLAVAVERLVEELEEEEAFIFPPDAPILELFDSTILMFPLADGTAGALD
jgi:hypothetical protein